ncbi:MAG: CDP-alcohol phosphatidyltransferase family protein [Candidatus Thermoplasmatota archaeon]|nr:CDP-alcohol phosphatidyltransferase family protein [Candidatus Thermoplasmatota archaeon]
MLGRYRKNVDWLFEPIARKIHIEPNTLTYISLIFAFFAGLSLYFSYWHHFLLVVASIMVLANGFLDALDGKVARLKNKATPKGDFIDHSIDRFADVFIVGGLASSPWCSPLVGIVAISGMLLTSYMGTQAQAVGYGREYGGLLGRADRLVILIFAPAIQYFLSCCGIAIFDRSFLQWVMVYFAVVGIATTIQRFVAVLRWFGKG